MGFFTLPGSWFSEWIGTASNYSGIEVEQFCWRKQIYRHRTFDDNLRPTEWLPGQHPIAEKLRKEGKSETDGFNHKNRF
jgi:hypothetical protein